VSSFGKIRLFSVRIGWTLHLTLAKMLRELN
jgi:hypothetical protein